MPRPSRFSPNCVQRTSPSRRLAPPVDYVLNRERVMTDLEARQRRLANNQTLFRSINSHVVELNEHFEGFGQGSVFVCECANTDCTEQVELSQADYERIRDNPRWFFVAASDEHVFLEVDLVVERNTSYYVVEKIEAGADVADETAAGQAL